MGLVSPGGNYLPNIGAMTGLCTEHGEGISRLGCHNKLYVPQTGWLETTKSLVSHRAGGWKSEIKVPAEPSSL